MILLTIRTAGAYSVVRSWLLYPSATCHVRHPCGAELMHMFQTKGTNMASSTQTASGNGLTVILAVVIIALLAVGAIYLMQDHRSGSERVGDAVQALPHGVDKAANQLGDQAPAKNVENNVDHAVDKATK